MEVPVFFNSDAVISGDLLFTSDIHLNCDIIGNIESEKKIVIGPEGFFKGTLKSRELVVFGKLEGEIIVSGPTVLHPGSAISGSLSTQVIEIIDCAFLDIRVNIINTEQVSEQVEFPVNAIDEVQPVTVKPNSTSTGAGAYNFNVDQHSGIPAEKAKKIHQPSEPTKNFLFTHFLETDLTHDSRYTGGLFEVPSELNFSKQLQAENRDPDRF